MRFREALKLMDEGKLFREVPATIWADPGDCGLRMERGAWRSPRDAHFAGMARFERLSAADAADLVAWLYATGQGSIVPLAAGEAGHVMIPE